MNASIRTGLGQNVSGDPRLTDSRRNAHRVRLDYRRSGEKHFAGAALFDETGEQLARATTLWIGGEPI